MSYYRGQIFYVDTDGTVTIGEAQTEPYEFVRQTDNNSNILDYFKKKLNDLRFLIAIRRIDDNCITGQESPNVFDTTPVGAYPDGVSPYGAYDMAGNVWKWTDSCEFSAIGLIVLIIKTIVFMDMEDYTEYFRQERELGRR